MMVARSFLNRRSVPLIAEFLQQQCYRRNFSQANFRKLVVSNVVVRGGVGETSHKYDCRASYWHHNDLVSIRFTSTEVNSSVEDDNTFVGAIEEHIDQSSTIEVNDNDTAENVDGKDISSDETPPGDLLEEQTQGFKDDNDESSLKIADGGKDDEFVDDGKDDGAVDDEQDDESVDDVDGDQKPSDTADIFSDGETPDAPINDIPAGPTPGPLTYYKTGEETFFQFDYRNVTKPLLNSQLDILLRKIESTAKDTELEPYCARRGTVTLRKNIEQLPDGGKFRLGGGKKSMKKMGEGYDKAVYVTSHRALRKAMINLIWERHAIMTTGKTHEWKKIPSAVIGQSLLGPDTRVVVDRKLGQDILQELWIRGVSSKYNRIIKKNKERSAERNFLRYLKPESEADVKKMDWNTDLGLQSAEAPPESNPTTRTPSTVPTKRKRSKSCR
jgi:hypothetical protein